jgi:hypothetical protein
VVNIDPFLVTMNVSGPAGTTPVEHADNRIHRGNRAVFMPDDTGAGNAVKHPQTFSNAFE